MAKKKVFTNSVFIDEYELELEQATYRNIDRLKDEKSIKKSHAKIVEILQSEKQNDNKYLDYHNYLQLVNDCKERKKKKKKEAKEQEQQHNQH